MAAAVLFRTLQIGMKKKTKPPQIPAALLNNIKLKSGLKRKTFFRTFTDIIQKSVYLKGLSWFIVALKIRFSAKHGKILSDNFGSVLFNSLLIFKRSCTKFTFD